MFRQALFFSKRRFPNALNPALCLAYLLLFQINAIAQPSCTYRGDLDVAFCDSDKNGLADLATSNLQSLGKSMTVAVLEPDDRSSKPLLAYEPWFAAIGKCANITIRKRSFDSEDAAIQAMRKDEVQLLWMQGHSAVRAVNKAGAQPWLAKGKYANNAASTYDLRLIVRKDSGIKTPVQLRGKDVDLMSGDTFMGGVGAQAFFKQYSNPALKPGQDFNARFSQDADKSVLGVLYGVWQASLSTSTEIDKLSRRGGVALADLSTIAQSKPMIEDVWLLPNNLDRASYKKLSACTEDFLFPDEMSKALAGNDRLFTVDYLKDWAYQRELLKSSVTK